MKNKKIFFVIVIGLIVACNTPFLNFIIKNLLLLENQANYIPDNSSIFYFEPTVIDDGSGEYWRYGKDKENYYYFSEENDEIYYYIRKNNNCDNFDPHNFTSWCNPVEVKHKIN